MRIAIISKGAWPQITGGAELVADRIRKNLEKRGHKVFFISKKWKLVAGARPEMSHIISWDWSKDAAARAVETKPDVVFVNQFWWEGASLFIPKRIPIILMAHGLGFIEMELDPDVKYQMIDVWHKSIRRADKVIVYGKNIRDRILIAFPQVKNKLVFIPLAID